MILSLHHNSILDASLGAPSRIYDEISAREAIEKAREEKKWIKKNLS